MTPTALQTTWFLLVGVLLTGFAILDGFDLGVGFWHLRARGDAERRALLRAIGPVWDGNEVWLLTGGGAIFAAFPPVYASVFSGFYLAMMLVVLMLITRAVALEFRGKVEAAGWRRAWDGAFAVSSTVAALLFGVALGNVLRGIPIDAAGNYTGTFLGLLNPYALMIGVLGLAMLAFHGANYAALKTDGELGGRARSWALGAGVAYGALFVAAAATTLATQQHLLENFRATPILWAIPTIGLAAIVAGVVFGRRGLPGRAFLASSVSIAAQLGLVGAGLYPRLVPALGDPALSLTAANSASSEKTLGVMLVLALVGMPIVLAYTIWAYRAFKGKVSVTDVAHH